MCSSSPITFIQTWVARLSDSSSDGVRVLLVEDETSISEPFSNALAREGFVPRIAASLAEARVALADEAPDIVLLDLMLPDGDGRELARELRASTQIPMIMLTARGSEIDRVVGLEIGGDARDPRSPASQPPAAGGGKADGRRCHGRCRCPSRVARGTGAVLDTQGVRSARPPGSQPRSGRDARGPDERRVG